MTLAFPQATPVAITPSKGPTVVARTVDPDAVVLNWDAFTASSSFQAPAELTVSPVPTSSLPLDPDGPFRHWAPDPCDVGNLQCCDSLIPLSSASATALLGLLGIVVGDVTGLVGVTCSTIFPEVGGDGVICNAQLACCTNNSFNGLVALDCSPEELI